MKPANGPLSVLGRTQKENCPDGEGLIAGASQGARNYFYELQSRKVDLRDRLQKRSTESEDNLAKLGAMLLCCGERWRSRAGELPKTACYFEERS